MDGMGDLGLLHDAPSSLARFRNGGCLVPLLRFGIWKSFFWFFCSRYTPPGHSTLAFDGQCRWLMRTHAKSTIEKFPLLFAVGR